MIMYHGTEVPAIILEEGLNPNSDKNCVNSQDGVIYLHDKMDFCSQFGCVLEVQVPNPEKLEKDPDSTGMMYPDYIAPNYISVSESQKEIWDNVTSFEVGW